MKLWRVIPRDAALDRLGCDWHFSARDHRLIAEKLRDYLAGLSLR